MIIICTKIQGWGKNTHTDVIPGHGGYGIVADIGTGTEPCLILRADIGTFDIDMASFIKDTFTIFGILILDVTPLLHTKMPYQ